MTHPDDDPWRWPEPRWRGAVNRVRAGRSLKPAAWPGGARVAVALSFDSDHETLTLRRGETSPGQLSQGEYGARVAIPRILKLLERHGLPATFYVPAVAALLHPDEQRRVAAEGHEIGLHGWIHEWNSKLDAPTERDLMFRAADVLEGLAGRRPVGLRTPSWDFSDATLTLIRELGLIYDSSLMADDEPYEILEDGAPTGIVEIPVEWIRDDAPFFVLNHVNPMRVTPPPSDVLEVLVREFDMAVAEGGLFQFTMHPHIVGHRSRIWVLEELVRHIKASGPVWFATHEQVARHCLSEAG